jgi:hypothetical protein
VVNTALRFSPVQQRFRTPTQRTAHSSLRPSVCCSRKRP